MTKTLGQILVPLTLESLAPQPKVMKHARLPFKIPSHQAKQADDDIDHFNPYKGDDNATKPINEKVPP